MLFEEWCLGEYLEVRGRKWQETGEDAILRGFITFTRHQTIIRLTKSRMMRWAVYIARMGEMSNAYKASVGKPEWKRLLGRPRRRWEDIIRVDLRELVWEVLDWIYLAQDGHQWRDVVNIRGRKLLDWLCYC
jgi:hypothetical protein